MPKAKPQPKVRSKSTSSITKSGNPANASPPTSSTSSPAWPSLSTTTPSTSLTLTTLVPAQIVTIRNLFPSALCREYVKFLRSLPLTTTPAGAKRGYAVRVNDRFQVDDGAFAQSLWTETGLMDVCKRAEGLWGGEVLGLNPNIRIYRYKKGQFFDQHYDDSNNVTFPSSPPQPSKTTWTLLLYLTSPASGCIGGETVFYPEPPIGAGKKGAGKKSRMTEPVVVGLEEGMALLHKHGMDCMLHEAREVIEGEKWVIRSDVCVKG